MEIYYAKDKIIQIFLVYLLLTIIMFACSIWIILSPGTPLNVNSTTTILKLLEQSPILIFFVLFGIISLCITLTKLNALLALTTPQLIISKDGVKNNTSRIGRQANIIPWSNIIKISVGNITSLDKNFSSINIKPYDKIILHLKDQDQYLKLYPFCYKYCFNKSKPTCNNCRNRALQHNINFQLLTRDQESVFREMLKFHPVENANKS